MQVASLATCARRTEKEFWGLLSQRGMEPSKADWNESSFPGKEIL